MSLCIGTEQVTFRVDEETLDLLEREAERLAISRAEVVRRVLDYYIASQDNHVRCHNCEAPLQLNLRE